MTSALINHVWQSTVFAVVVGLLAIAFRKNRAQVRYWMWLSASLKFLLPFSLLMGLGARVEWAPATRTVAATPAVALTMVQMSQPFSDTSPLAPSTGSVHDWTAIAFLGVWACGFLAIALIRWRDWRSIRAAVRSSTPVEIPATVEVRSSPGLLEPGVVGLFRPILLLPEGIAERLTPSQLAAVLAHELCHVRRRDNFTSAIHMIVEAVFWFYPLVWWIGARLLKERERACDEAVLRLGSEPHDYAEGILAVYKSYLESPLYCVSGVTGSNLKTRIQAILTGRSARDLTIAKKLVLAAAGIVALGVPIVAGIVSAPRIQAQSQSSLTRSAATPKLQTVSIKPCSAFRPNPYPKVPLGTFSSGCTTVERLTQQAYGLFANGHMNPLSSVTVSGGPAWVGSALYEINAKAAGPESRSMMNGPMLQALLEDRFKLKAHHETREVPVYKLTVAGSGAKLEPFKGSCIPPDFDHPRAEASSIQCGTSRPAGNGFDMSAATMADLGMLFVVTLDRPVVDQTGLTGRYNFHLELPREFGRRARVLPALSDPAAPGPEPAVISAIKTAVAKLGLRLEPATGPGDFLVIDHIERP
jgi:bla regulator protein BlaR1